jgi:hypothetical protein
LVVKIGFASPAQRGKKKKMAEVIEFTPHEGHFKYGTEDLYQLIDPKSPDLLRQMGGVKALAKGLKASLKTGLTASDDFEIRKSVYVIRDSSALFPRRTLCCFIFCFSYQAASDPTACLRKS